MFVLLEKTAVVRPRRFVSLVQEDVNSEDRVEGAPLAGTAEDVNSDDRVEGAPALAMNAGDDDEDVPGPPGSGVDADGPAPNTRDAAFLEASTAEDHVPLGALAMHTRVNSQFCSLASCATRCASRANDQALPAALPMPWQDSHNMGAEPPIPGLLQTGAGGYAPNAGIPNAFFAGVAPPPVMPPSLGAGIAMPMD